jgi:hypothetical protein
MDDATRPVARREERTVMNDQPRSEFFSRWAESEGSALRRALVGVPVAVGLLALTVALVELASIPGEALLVFAVISAIGYGAYVRGWVAVPVAYLGIVLSGWIIEITTFLYLGVHEWEHRNREHWQGDDPVAMKLAGQLLEYVAIPLLIVPFVALGIVVGLVGARARRRPRHPNRMEPAGT